MTTAAILIVAFLVGFIVAGALFGLGLKGQK